MESDPNKWTERLKRVLQDELPGRECSDLRGLRTAASITMIRTFFKSEEEMRQDLLRFLSFYTAAGR